MSFVRDKDKVNKTKTCQRLSCAVFHHLHVFVLHLTVLILCVCVCARASLSLSLSRIDTLTGALERPSNYHSTSIYSIYKHSFLPEDVILFHNWIKSMHSSWKRQQKYFQWIFQLQSQKCRLTKKCSGGGGGLWILKGSSLEYMSRSRSCRPIYASCRPNYNTSVVICCFFALQSIT